MAIIVNKPYVTKLVPNYVGADAFVVSGKDARGRECYLLSNRDKGEKTSTQMKEFAAVLNEVYDIFTKFNQSDKKFKCYIVSTGGIEAEPYTAFSVDEVDSPRSAALIYVAKGHLSVLLGGKNLPTRSDILTLAKKAMQKAEELTAKSIRFDN